MRLRGKVSLLCVVVFFCFFNVVSASETAGNPSNTKQYFYDQANRLEGVKYWKNGQELMKNFTYDNNGNLIWTNIAWYKDTFEHKDFSSTNFMSGYSAYPGVITRDSPKVITGKSSALGESPDTEEWSEFLQTDVTKLQLEPNTTYRISFNYKVNRLSSMGGEFYFLARSPEAYLWGDKGFTTWTGSVGQVTGKEIDITTGNTSSYYLIWGIHNGGSISIDDIVIKKAKESFESDFETIAYTKGASMYPGVITKESAKVINGKSSALGESPDTEEWSEFLHTDLSKYQFEPNTTYDVSFNYKINRVSSKGGEFYFLARSSEAYLSGDKGSTTWKGTVGQIASKTISFTTGDKNSYYLIWGVHNGGSISIDDIEIRKVKESFESDFDTIAYKKGASKYPGVITKELTKILTGKGSVLGESPDTEEWSEFLQTDGSKLQLQPNTRYKVSFNYKINRLSTKSGEFYFLARSFEAYLSGDMGFTTWTGTVGQVTGKTLYVTTGNKSSYYFIWGIHNGGSISIDDIEIEAI